MTDFHEVIQKMRSLQNKPVNKILPTENYRHCVEEPSQMEHNSSKRNISLGYRKFN